MEWRSFRAAKSSEFDAVWIRLNTIPQRDGRTDGNRISISRISSLTREKNNQLDISKHRSTAWRMVKGRRHRTRDAHWWEMVEHLYSRRDEVGGNLFCHKNMHKWTSRIESRQVRMHRARKPVRGVFWQLRGRGSAQLRGIIALGCDSCRHCAIRQRRAMKVSCSTARIYGLYVRGWVFGGCTMQSGSLASCHCSCQVATRGGHTPGPRLRRPPRRRRSVEVSGIRHHQFDSVADQSVYVRDEAEMNQLLRSRACADRPIECLGRCRRWKFRSFLASWAARHTSLFDPSKSAHCENAISWRIRAGRNATVERLNSDDHSPWCTSKAFAKRNDRSNFAVVRRRVSSPCVRWYVADIAPSIMSWWWRGFRLVLLDFERKRTPACYGIESTKLNKLELPHF